MPPDAKPPEVIEAGVAVLRRWRPADVDAACRAVVESMDHLRPWMPWADNFTVESEAEFIAQSQADWESGAAFNYAILVDGEIAGSVGLMARIDPGGLEIGYWIHKDYTRRGLATAASAAVVEQAFALPGIDHVEIVHDEMNVASGGIPRKLGFTETGRRPLAAPPADGTGMGVVWRLNRRSLPGGRYPAAFGWPPLLTGASLAVSSTFATSSGLSVIGTCPQSRSLTNRACGIRCRATRASDGGSTRSLSPQAIVTGISALMLDTNGSGCRNTARITGHAAANAGTSPRACSGVTRDGWQTIEPYSTARPAVDLDSAGTSGSMARDA
jgi:ribosomal-protein-serine acetyltransferase